MICQYHCQNLLKYTSEGSIISFKLIYVCKYFPLSVFFSITNEFNNYN